MKSVSVKQIQKLDQIAINAYGVASLALMENAGSAVTKHALSYLKRKSAKRASVICGVGNNAGDGFVITRHLINHGVKVDVFLIGRKRNLKCDAKANFEILHKLKIPVVEINQLDSLSKSKLKKSDLIVDAIFGVGLNRDIESPIYEVIDYINQLKTYVISVDVPSGLNADTGEIFKICIKANKTIAFTFAKNGFLKMQAKKFIGKVIVVDIGIPIQLLKKV